MSGVVGLAAPWDSLPGTWTLTLVSEQGPRTAREVRGSLILVALPDSLRRINRPGPEVTVPVVGYTDIALEEVAAERIGNVRSTDLERPGVSIWVSRGAEGAVSAVMRIGQEQIHTNLLPFEGAYTALYLRHVSGTAISGSWASGGGRGQRASGHFCATRTEP